MYTDCVLYYIIILTESLYIITFFMLCGDKLNEQKKRNHSHVLNVHIVLGTEEIKPISLYSSAKL